MGMGYSPNSVYYDSEKGQYYTINNPAGAIFASSSYMNPSQRAGFEQYQNFLGQPQNSQKSSMVTSGMERAQKAYDAALAGMNANPAYNLSSLFPQMTSPNMGTPSTGTPNMGMYGAGRFLSPAAGQATGGVLGLDFSAPGTTT